MEPEPIPISEAAGPSPWREPVRGGYPDPPIFRQAPSVVLRAMAAGTAPQPPISRLTGMRLVECGIGTTSFTMPLSDWLCTSQGAIAIGPLTVPADAAMACAIQMELPPATPLTTAELSLRLLRPAPAGGLITARGRVIDVRRTIALAEVTITDEDERLIAHGSSLCVLHPDADRAPAVEAPQPRTSTPPPVEEGPDPWQRPSIGEVLSQDVWERMTGLEVLRAQLDDELPAPPIQHLTGLRPTEASERQATFAMPTTEWLCAPVPGRVQGGAVALLAEAGLSGAIQTTVPARTALAPIDVKVNYLRPLAADGRLATAAGRMIHSGRRVAVATAEVVDADGRPVAVATGSGMLLPGRAVALRRP